MVWWLVLALASPCLPLHCSPWPPDQAHTASSRDPATGDQLTRATLALRPGASVCLQTGAGLAAALTLVSASVHHRVVASYRYTWPRVSVQCYCTCAPRVCRVAACPLCYNLSLVTPPCPGPAPAPVSSTCCSLELSTPHPARTALQLGRGVAQLRYSLQLFPPSSDPQLHTRTVHLGAGGGATLHHALPQGDLVVRLGGVAAPASPGSWYVAGAGPGSGVAAAAPGSLNTVTSRRPELAGWLRVRASGEVEPPSPQLVGGAVRVATLGCRDQTFAADLSGLSTEPGQLQPDPSLAWTQDKVVMEASDQLVSLSFTFRGSEAVTIFGNETRLGSWEAAITVTEAETLLNITAHRSLGLVLGDIEDVSFSFFLATPAVTARIVSRVPSLVSVRGGAGARVCLRVVRGAASCAMVPVTVLPAPRPPAAAQPRVRVQSIPVLWHTQAEDGDYRPEDNRTAGQVLHWMQSLLSSTDPILVFVNCSVIFLLLTCSIRLVACLLPKCNK